MQNQGYPGQPRYAYQRLKKVASRIGKNKMCYANGGTVVLGEWRRPVFWANRVDWLGRYSPRGV